MLEKRKGAILKDESRFFFCISKIVEKVLFKNYAG